MLTFHACTTTTFIEMNIRHIENEPHLIKNNVLKTKRRKVKVVVVGGDLKIPGLYPVSRVDREDLAACKMYMEVSTSPSGWQSGIG